MVKNKRLLKTSAGVVRLVKTCVGLVSEYSVMCIADRATAIALESGITYEEALRVLFKLASEGVNGWYKIGDDWYLDFNYEYDYFVVNTWREDDIEIVCLYPEDFNILYSVKDKKYYKEYASSEYGDELIKEEIEIWKRKLKKD